EASVLANRLQIGIAFEVSFASEAGVDRASDGFDRLLLLARQRVGTCEVVVRASPDRLRARGLRERGDRVGVALCGERGESEAQPGLRVGFVFRDQLAIDGDRAVDVAAVIRDRRFLHALSVCVETWLELMV